MTTEELKQTISVIVSSANSGNEKRDELIKLCESHANERAKKALNNYADLVKESNSKLFYKCLEDDCGDGVVKQN